MEISFVFCNLLSHKVSDLSLTGSISSFCRWMLCVRGSLRSRGEEVEECREKYTFQRAVKIDAFEYEMVYNNIDAAPGSVVFEIPLRRFSQDETKTKEK